MGAVRGSAVTPPGESSVRVELGGSYSRTGRAVQVRVHLAHPPKFLRQWDIHAMQLTILIILRV